MLISCLSLQMLTYPKPLGSKAPVDAFDYKNLCYLNMLKVSVPLVKQG